MIPARTMKRTGVGILFVAVSLTSADKPARTTHRSVNSIARVYANVPLAFEANEGQFEPHVRFAARGRGYGLFLTDTEAVFAFGTSGSRLRMRLVDTNPSATLVGVDRLPGKSNYLIGNNPDKWRRNVPTYAKVRSDEIYPGIDAVYYGKQKQLEYDFVVSPGADPDRIRMAFEGADRIQVDQEGALIVHTSAGEVRQEKPFIYQDIDGVRQQVRGGYVLDAHNRIGFEVAAYDTSQPLVLDPVLDYSARVGGSDRDEAFGIAVDNSGAAYVTGFTLSADFPTTAGSLAPTFGGGFGDVFIAKLDPTGSSLIYATYLGGTGSDEGGLSISVDAAGAAYVAGVTGSADFPTTVGAFDSTINDGGFRDAFVAKLGADGASLLYSTFLGGNDSDGARGITIDNLGSAYVTGFSYSNNFPTTPGAFDTTFNGGSADVFVAKLDAAGSALLYSTALGGAAGNDFGVAIAIDAAGAAYVTGFANAGFPTTPNAFDTTFNSGTNGDAFVTKVDPTGSFLAYSTYLGGGRDEQAVDIAVLNGHAYVTGITFSADFPTIGAIDSGLDGPWDAFVTKLDLTGSALVYSTYVGGAGGDQGIGIAVDSTGAALIVGATSSDDFPTTADAIDRRLTPPSTRTNDFSRDAFVAKIDSSGTTLAYSTYLGGGGDDVGWSIAVDATNSAYVCGYTESADFPLRGRPIGPFDRSRDGFIVKIAE